MTAQSHFQNKKDFALTVDVEDYFHVAAFDNHINRNDWGSKYPSRVVNNTERLLDIFLEHDVKATFFMLGWVAEAFPSLTRKITEHGHELASHGYFHEKATNQTAFDFRKDVYRSKALLEDITGIEIQGYRAPSFSINQTNEWTYQILFELGFVYSSSTYPVKHDQYGAPNWPKALYKRAEGIIEIPIPTLDIFGKNIPIGGGGFFRLYPYKLSKFLIKRYHNKTGLPYSFYFHPWEIDCDQPRINDVSAKSQFRHYLNLNRMQARICNLLSDFSWNTMRHVYQINETKNGTRNPNKKNAYSGSESMGLLYR